MAWLLQSDYMGKDERIPLTTPDLGPERVIKIVYICVTSAKGPLTKMGKQLYGERS